MLAIEIINHQLHPTDRPVPQPSDSQVLIKVSAAGVNRPDIMQRKGLYPPPAGASDIPGLEIAGIVTEIGSTVSQLKKGDKVCALVTGGAYAEYCLAYAYPFLMALTLFRLRPVSIPIPTSTISQPLQAIVMLVLLLEVIF